MKHFFGVGVGTTTITALVLDLVDATIVARATTANDTEIISAEDRRLGRSEWVPDQILDRVKKVIRLVVADGGSAIEAVGVTGLMHGMLVVDEAGGSVGPFIGWQDQRGIEPLDRGPSAVKRLGTASGSDVSLRRVTWAVS